MENPITERAVYDWFKRSFVRVPIEICQLCANTLGISLDAFTNAVLRGASFARTQDNRLHIIYPELPETMEDAREALAA
jgi:hypothetical protein